MILYAKILLSFIKFYSLTFTQLTSNGYLLAYSMHVAILYHRITVNNDNAMLLSLNEHFMCVVAVGNMKICVNNY